MQEKEIIITNLAFKKIEPKAGQNWKGFNVYQIQGNDGITYETTDKDYYAALKLGETKLIQFNVESKTSGGRVYTSHKIVTPKMADKEKKANEGTDKILLAIEALKRDILAAIKLTCGSPKIDEDVKDPKQISLFEDQKVTEEEEDEPPY